MSIYHICTTCQQKLPNHRCLASDNPFDESCEKHEQFMQLEQQRMRTNNYGR